MLGLTAELVDEEFQQHQVFLQKMSGSNNAAKPTVTFGTMLQWWEMDETRCHVML